MCGIAGIWNLNREPLGEDTLRSFTDALLHRGPDGSGYYVDEQAQLGLGHRRLSIIDLSENGKQPMSYGEERYRITFNGEVFNFIELQQELETKGYSFRSRSDTEVILAAYHCWGKDCLLRFNGMWGMAIWDKQEQSLFLARDRFGIKPLFYLYLQDKLFAFASETVAFKALKGFNRKTDPGNLARVIADPNALIGKGYTVFENIFQLLPGHCMTLKAGSKPVQNRWWSTAGHLHQVPVSYEDQVEKFRELFEDACRIRMRSDVPIATALSGGVDSSAVNCMMYHLMNSNRDKTRIPENWQHAFVSYQEGTDQDERAYAEEVIAFTKGRATYIQPDYKQIIAGMDDATRGFDDVMGSPISLFNDLYGSIRDAGIKVSIDGHGVDEMLFGYPYLVREAFAWANASGNKTLTDDIRASYSGLFEPDMQAGARTELDKFEKSMHRSAFKKTAALAFPSFLKTYLQHKGNAGITELRNLPVKALAGLSDRKEDLHRLNLLEKSVYKGFHEDILQAILRHFDRSSMQNQIEIRMPMMDWRLVTYVFSLPLESKLGGGYTKRILRDSMKGLMPETIRTRTLKKGMSAPLVAWFREGMKEYVTDKVNSRHFLESPVWNGPLIRNQVLKHYEQDSWTWSECSRVWTYLNADIIAH
ncbi:MAG: asparagine synthase (glutamine-hydrolyzing) [Bacteroidia bacterium]